MLHISLFSGIGGFDLAAQWAGWENIVSCEINPFGNKVLNHYWPDAYHHTDIHTLTYNLINDELTKRKGQNWRTKDIIITGGFPCQDASIAKQDGQGQKGLQGSRTGLFWEMVRIIDEIKPKYIVAENVSNFLKTNGGKDIRTALSELARMGYNAEWRVCRSSEVGSPHHRSRLYLVAYPMCFRLQKGKSFFSYVAEETSSFSWRPYGATIQISRGGSWNSEPPILCVDDGISNKLARIAIQGYGNAVTPQIPYKIFKAINEYEK